jgi:hypothetical protein
MIMRAVVTGGDHGWATYSIDGVDAKEPKTQRDLRPLAAPMPAWRRRLPA